MAIQVTFFIVGLAVLAVGAETLVRGGVKLARIFGLSPLLVGLTILAYGTSLPELVVSVLAASKGSGNIALGNAIGSNLINTGLILGLAAWIFPVVATPGLFSRDLPLHLSVVIFFGILCWDGTIDGFDGALLLLAMTGYIATTVWTGLENRDVPVKLPPDSPSANHERWWVAALLIVAGSAGLYVGAEWMVDSAVFIAKSLGIGERVIGITIIALGTSLPELATTLSAARRHDSALVIGNLVGSNIFNLLLIVGAAGVIAPFSFAVDSVSFDLIFLLANSLALFVLFGFGQPRRMRRWGGVALTIMYGLFLAVLFLRAAD